MVTPDQVKRRYYAIVGLWNLSASAIWGVNTLFLLGAGLSLYETFIANAFYTAGMVLFEIPTGVVADTRGRRTSFLAALAVLLVGTLLYVWLAEIGAGLVAFSAASVLLGLGFTFYSGAVEAWLVDALNASNYEGELDPVFARGGQFQGIAMLIGTVGGGLLGTLNLSLPYVARAILLGLLFVVALRGMHDIGFTTRKFRFGKIPEELNDIWQASVKHGWRDRRIRLLILIAFLHWGFLIWGWYAWQPHFLELLGRPDAIWVAGIIAALVSLTMIIGNQFAGPLTRRLGRRSRTMALTVTVYSSAMLGVGLTSNFYLAVGLFLLALMAFSVTMPVQTAAMHQCLPSEVRATVVSFGGLVVSAGQVGSQVGLGRFSQDYGIAPGYIIGGAVGFLALPVVYLIARIGGPADIVRPRRDESTPAT